NFKDQLENLPVEQAIKKVGTLKTIAVLAQHIHFYIAGVKKVLEVGTLDIRDAYSFDFPPMETQEQWQLFLITFWRDAEEFTVLVEQIPEDQLSEPFVKEKYGTYLRNIDGMIEHCYYHLGQIVLINKILLDQEK
ncbi:MAG TPA: DUF1572 domain-containing protein, partial [Flavobacteriaceae bacterium]|nr:DUF1572 domain-containing protein [Flavobacteriaceae bacterium]